MRSLERCLDPRGWYPVPRHFPFIVAAVDEFYERGDADRVRDDLKRVATEIRCDDDRLTSASLVN